MPNNEFKIIFKYKMLVNTLLEYKIKTEQDKIIPKKDELNTGAEEQIIYVVSAE